MNIFNFLSKWIVLEPLIVLTMMTVMKDVTRQNMFMDKIAKNQFNVTNIHDNTTMDEVQKATSTFLSRFLTFLFSFKVETICVFWPQYFTLMRFIYSNTNNNSYLSYNLIVSRRCLKTI